MKYSREIYLACKAFVLGASALAVASTQADTIYDSQGFETPTFTTGSIVGQEGFTVFGGGQSTATVATAPGAQVASGTQALELFRDGADGATTTGFFTDLSTPAANHDRYVFVDFDLFVESSGDQDPGPAASFGPGFGIEIYTTGVNRIASIGVDSADGAFYQLNGGTGLFDFSAGSVAVLDQYQSWRVILDFELEVYFVQVDGIVITASGGESFTTDIDYDSGDFFTDASILVTPTDNAYPAVNGTAFLDNYLIFDDTVIPEPASMVIFGGIGAVMLMRKRSAATTKR